jgi:Ca2+-binding EF-hand superfamily protein
MKQHYIRITKEEAELIIKEYDSNLDENLDFEEFTKVFLPSTNLVLREIALQR